MENLSAREWVLAVLTAATSAAIAYLTLRQKNRTEDRTFDQQAQQQKDARSDQLETNTIGQWKVLYFQKCEEVTQIKAECQANGTKLMTEVGGLKDDLMEAKIKLAEAEAELKRCRQDLRETRKRRGADGGGSDEG